MAPTGDCDREAERMAVAAEVLVLVPIVCAGMEATVKPAAWAELRMGESERPDVDSEGEDVPAAPADDDEVDDG